MASIAWEIAFCGIISAAAFFVLRALSRNQTRGPLPPGPPGLPLIGNAHEMGPNVLVDNLCRWSKQYSDNGVISLKSFDTTTIVLSKAKCVADLMDRRATIYSSRPRWLMLDFMGIGPSPATQPYGEELKLQRKMMSSVLGPRPSRETIPIQESVMRRTLYRIFEKPKEFRNHLNHGISNVILRVTHDYHWEEDDEDDRNVYYMVKYLTYFGEGMAGNYLIRYLPLYKYVPLKWWLPSTRALVEDARAVAHHVKGTMPDMVKEKMRLGTVEPCYISKLMEAIDPQSPTAAAEEQRIRNSSSSLFAGGAETSMTTIVSFILAMVLNPDVQKKAQAELDEAIGQGRFVTMDDRALLPYVDGIMKETLRWAPLTRIGVPHAVTEDDEYMGMFIPKGATVISNIQALMYDEEVYTIPGQFRPERFLGEEPAVDPFKFAFGFGRRRCPGIELATSSVFLNVANMLNFFTISAPIDASGKPIFPKNCFNPGPIMSVKDFDAVFAPRTEAGAKTIVSSQ